VRGVMLDSDIEDLSQKNICFDCVKEIYLSGRIKKERKVRKCSYCGRRRSCYSIGEMTDVIEEAFQQYYVRTSDQPDSWEYGLLADQESDYRWERDGEPVVYAIMNAADIPEEAAHDIQYILEDRHADIESAKMGEETEFDSDSYYEEKGVGVGGPVLQPNGGEPSGGDFRWYRGDANLGPTTRRLITSRPKL
jgi:hypothetical protein